MGLKQSSFSKHYLEIEIEGFKINELLTMCAKKGVIFRQVRYIDEVCVHGRIRKSDLHTVEKLGKNKYRITVNKEGGYDTRISCFFQNKGRIIGLVLFACIIYVQSLFVTEVRIEGYERITEAEVRSCLEEAGLKVGAFKDLDLEGIKLHLYNNLDNVVYVGIVLEGCLARVEIVEGGSPPDKVEKSTPCHIVADREGYVHQIIPTEGVRSVEDGAYVKKGDVLISGIVPLKSTAYGQPGSEKTERYVHAAGKAVIRAPERLTYNQSPNKIVKEETGNFFYNIRVSLAGKSFSLENLYNPYEISQVTSSKKIDGIRPFPYEISVEKIEEIQLKSQIRTEEEITKEVNKLIRQDIKEKMQENPQILNKSLYFTREKNIIEVTVMLETLQEIGIEQEIVFGEQNYEHEEASN